MSLLAQKVHVTCFFKSRSLSLLCNFPYKISAVFKSYCVQNMQASLVAQRERIRRQCRRCGFDPWVGEIPWRRKWQTTPIFLPGKSYGQRSMAGYIQSTGLQESDTAEQLHHHQYRKYYIKNCWSLVWQIPHGATKPMCHDYWACLLEPARWLLELMPESPCSAKKEPRAPQLESSPHSPQLEKSLQATSSTAKNK